MQRERADAENERKGGADQRTLHADSTSGQVITHIRPYLRAPGSFGAKQKPGGQRRAGPGSLWRQRESIARH
ncbi:hypothetical protein SZ55_2531 [Pseudomonas sp. FeS53a]|nr:hypothetical protein SZ55_2531 [Pseudomonas sp. FeS53a]